MIDDMTGPGECVSWNTIWRKSLIFPIICIRVGKIKISLTEKRKIFVFLVKKTKKGIFTLEENILFVYNQ